MDQDIIRLLLAEACCGIGGDNLSIPMPQQSDSTKERAMSTAEPPTQTPIDDVYDLAQSAVRTVRQSMATEELVNQGGMLVVAIEKPGKTEVYDAMRLGSIPREKVAERVRLAREKVLRLLSHPEHATARESADETREQYPGAIRFRSTNVFYVFGFSGFTTADDELVCHELAKLMSLGGPCARETNPVVAPASTGRLHFEHT